MEGYPKARFGNVREDLFQTCPFVVGLNSCYIIGMRHEEISDKERLDYLERVGFTTNRWSFRETGVTRWCGKDEKDSAQFWVAHHVGYQYETARDAIDAAIRYERMKDKV